MRNEPLPRAHVETVVLTIESKYSSGTRTYVLDDVSVLDITETSGPDGRENLTLHVLGAKLI